MDRKALLEAEIASISQKSNKAFEKYRLALDLNRDTDSLEVRALAQELLGRHHLRVGDKTRGISALEEACVVCQKWGAVAKAERLQEDIHNLSK